MRKCNTRKKATRNVLNHFRKITKSKRHSELAKKDAKRILENNKKKK